MASLSRDRRPGRAHPRRGAGQDRGPLRQGQGHGRAQGESVESRMLEVEQAALNTEAQARLSEIRAQLGLAPADGRSPAPPAAAERSRRRGRRPQPRSRRQAADPAPALRSDRLVPEPIARETSAGLGQDDEVVAVDDLVGDALGEVAVRLPGDRAHDRGAASAPGPWRTPRRRGRRPRPRRRRRRRPRPRRRRRAAATARSHRAPGGRPSSTTTVPTSRRRRRSRACGPAAAGRGAARRCRRRARRRPRRRARRSRSAAAITARTPDQAAILAAASFDAMPPLPRTVPGAAGHAPRARGRPRRSPRSATPTRRAGDRR